MFRILFRLCLWVLVGQWAYSEVKLVFPSAIPVIELALTKLQIPTHDRWSAKSIDAFIADARKFGQASLTPARQTAQIAKGSDNARPQELMQINLKEWRSIPRRISNNESFSRF